MRLYNVFKTLKHNILKVDNTYNQKNQIKNYPICENIWFKISKWWNSLYIQIDIFQDQCFI
jgi:hypothetical protein